MSTERYVLFDLDGTLFDYAAAEGQAVARTLVDAGLSADGEVVATYRRVNARHWAALERGETTADRLRLERWEEVLAAHGVRGIDVVALAERYLAHLAAGSQLVPGAHEVVATVARHHPVGFVTNGLADVQRPRLEASPLAAYAATVVISDEVGVAKPDPAIFRAALRGLGQPPPEPAVMVGDNLNADIGGAAALGMTTVWVAPSSTPAPAATDPQPTHRVAAVQEVPALLGLAS